VLGGATLVGMVTAFIAGRKTAEKTKTLYDEYLKNYCTELNEIWCT
jgi:hypothetical protein